MLSMLVRLCALSLLTTLPQWALKTCMHGHYFVNWHFEMCEELLVESGVLVLEAEPTSASAHDHDDALARVQHALFLTQVLCLRASLLTRRD